MRSYTKEQINKPVADRKIEGGVKHFGPSWYKLAFQIIVFQILAFLVVEFSLLLAGLGEEEIFKLDPLLGFSHMENKKVTWRSEGLATSYFNADGMREPGLTIAKPAGIYRIALLGDSLTESLQVPVESSFGFKIQKELKELLGRPVQVANFGTSGYSTAQEYLQLKSKVLKYKPDLVLLCYNSRDCFENWSPPDEVLTNVRPAALHLPGGKLVVDSSPVSQWLKSPRARFLKQVELLRQHSRLWGIYSAAELDWSLHNETYKRLVLFFTRPGKAIRLISNDLSAYFKATCTELSSKLASGLKATTKTPASKTAALRSASLAATAPEAKAPAAKAALENPSLAANAPEAKAPAAKAASGNPGSALTTAAATPGAAAPADLRLNYQELIVRTLGSLIAEMRDAAGAAGAGFAVVAMPVRSALYAKQGMQTSFNDYDYNDELKMLLRVCKEKDIKFLNMHEPAKTLTASERDYLFYLVHLTPKGHEFLASKLTPELKKLIEKD